MYLYDRLFTLEEPDDVEGKDFTDLLNPGSLEVLTGCKLEPSLKDTPSTDRFQFERLGYFCIDSADQQIPANTGKLVFNRIITLRDSDQGGEVDTPPHRRLATAHRRRHSSRRVAEQGKHDNTID